MTEVVIKARANGPYKVEGPVRIVDAEGNEFVLPEGSAVALCRCGHSRTKPFCDKSHRRVGFVADDVSLRKTEGSDFSQTPVREQTPTSRGQAEA